MKVGLQYCKDNNIPVEIRTLNVDNVVNLKAPLLGRDLIEAILTGKPYAQYFKGTPLLATQDTQVELQQKQEACVKLITGSDSH